MERAAFADGALTKLIKELIALAISVVINCGFRMQWHIEQAAKAGASQQEVREAIEVGVEMGEDRQALMRVSRSRSWPRCSEPEAGWCDRPGSGAHDPGSQRCRGAGERQAFAFLVHRSSARCMAELVSTCSVDESSSQRDPRKLRKKHFCEGKSSRDPQQAGG